MCEVRSSRLLVAASFFDLLAILIPLLLTQQGRDRDSASDEISSYEASEYIPKRSIGLTGQRNRRRFDWEVTRTWLGRGLLVLTTK